MKVFISWSGNTKAVAQAIYSCLPSLFDDAKPWISTENRSGSIWLPEIDKQLSDTDFGIVCVSKQNQGAPWLNYEAGALSRKVDAKRELMPVLLVDFDDTVEVKGPVTGFQMKFATLDGFYSIMKDLNESELGPGIDTDILRKRVELIWPTIDAEVQKVNSSHGSQDVKKRTEDDKYEELLVTVRDIAETTAILAHQRWGGPGPDFKLSDHDMRAAAKAIGDVGRGCSVRNS
ncbi:toll/interleukin-1 receptor domain-containing protein [Arthrobacter bambusae]|uniref:toll/interleukin-1 receptor domain-containing protein n=1 Tax=Arthrobacter bambusae TaxID=1338426 RepID=UPI001F50A5D9|nr:toll/interleukin-1 receptor domain-containing protein [Arthrobacter bambusae]MCI0144052.1 toll/interleukin-1 receptor domain-containing protein [Arthrobacter bambusae]